VAKASAQAAMAWRRDRADISSGGRRQLPGGYAATALPPAGRSPRSGIERFALEDPHVAARPLAERGLGGLHRRGRFERAAGRDTAPCTQRLSDLRGQRRGPGTTPNRPRMTLADALGHDRPLAEQETDADENRRRKQLDEEHDEGPD